VDALNKRFLLLLSATPVQNDLMELYNVLTLLKPGIFKTPKEFRAAHVTPGKPHQPANHDRLRADSGEGGQAFHLKADSESGRWRTAFR
jgi:hypothetical protein